MSCHVSIPITSLLPFSDRRKTLEASLDRDITMFRGQTYAIGTQATYRSHRRAYLKFCHALGYPAVPATPQTIQRYACFLARTLKFTSIKQYLNIIRIMHLEWGLPNSLSTFPLQCLMRGIKRSIGHNVNKKPPITPYLLDKILRQLDLSKYLAANVWSACLVLFLGFLRKASILPASTRRAHTNHLLCRKDILFNSQGVTITIRKTKTIQIKERVLQVVLPRCPGHALCPAQALFHSMSLTNNRGERAPAFTSDQQGTPLSGPAFVQRVRQCLETAGIPSPSQYTGHSFRRGGSMLRL